MGLFWYYSGTAIVTNIVLWAAMWRTAKCNQQRRPKAAQHVRRAVLWLIAGFLAAFLTPGIAAAFGGSASVPFLLANFVTSILSASALLHLAYAALVQPDRPRAPMKLSGIANPQALQPTDDPPPTTN